jgi:hypothetical protein
MENTEAKPEEIKTHAEAPTVYVIAGPNGAGKTTFANEFLPDFVNCRQFLNADLIAAGLSPFAPETQNMRAGPLLTSGAFMMPLISLPKSWRMRKWGKSRSSIPRFLKTLFKK